MLLENNPYPLDVRVRSEAESLARAGYAVVVCAPRDPGQARRERIGGVDVRRYRLPETPARAWGFLVEYGIASLQLHLAAVRELLRGARVVHLHNPPETLFPAAFLARALGRRVVFDHHDLTPELFAAKFGRSPVVAVLKTFERLTMKAASHVVAANESHREVALTRGGKQPGDVTVVRNGPPASALSVPAKPRDGVLGNPRLAFLGSMESQDGVDMLPELMRRLASDHGLAEARLVMIGAGSRRADLERAFAEAGVADRVRFTGQVPHDQVPALLADADICLDPAPCTELNHSSTMIKIAEYMAAARPVVAFPLRETQSTAGDVLVYAAADDVASFAAAVAGLAADPAARSSRGAAGRERAQALTWEHSERALLEAYSALG